MLNSRTGEEELQQTADLLDHRFLERLQHFDFVGFRQTALALGEAGFLVAQTVAAHDLVGQLLAAEHLLTRVDRALALQHDQRRHRGADVDDRNDRILRHRELIGDQLERVLHRERLDVDDLGAKAAKIERRDAQVDVLGARGREQDVDHVRVVLDGTQHFEVETDFLDRIGDVLIRLDLDLRLHVLFAEISGHGDDLGDDG